MSELAARFRAARAYADLTQFELAQALGVDVQTVKRREAGKGDPKRAELIAIASITGVPETFMLDGFNRSYEKQIREVLQGLEIGVGEADQDESQQKTAPVQPGTARPKRRQRPA
jgi:transcriptional regulator with XRE-family HTH domain